MVQSMILIGWKMLKPFRSIIWEKGACCLQTPWTKLAKLLFACKSMGDQIQCHQTKPQLQDCIKSADQYFTFGLSYDKEPSNPWVLVESSSKNEHIFLFSLHSPILRTLIGFWLIQWYIWESRNSRERQIPKAKSAKASHLGPKDVRWIWGSWSIIPLVISSMILKMSFVNACPCSQHDFSVCYFRKQALFILPLKPNHGSSLVEPSFDIPSSVAAVLASVHTLLSCAGKVADC